MKRSVAAVGAAVLAFSATAQNANDAQQVVVPALKTPVTRVYAPPEDFKLYKGQYSLSNGKVLSLTRRETRMYAQVGSQPEHEIIRTGEGAFLALDGQMSMKLQYSSMETVSGTLTYVDTDQRTAGLPALVTITLAQR